MYFVHCLVNVNTYIYFFFFFNSPVYNVYCKEHYANGYCDYGCNNAECNWDGLDCEKEPPALADGAISVIVLMDMKNFKEHLVSFLREVILKTICWPYSSEIPFLVFCFLLFLYS